MEIASGLETGTWTNTFILLKKYYSLLNLNAYLIGRSVFLFADSCWPPPCRSRRYESFTTWLSTSGNIHCWSATGPLVVRPTKNINTFRFSLFLKPCPYRSSQVQDYHREWAQESSFKNSLAAINLDRMEHLYHSRRDSWVSWIWELNCGSAIPRTGVQFSKANGRGRTSCDPPSFWQKMRA